MRRILVKFNLEINQRTLRKFAMIRFEKERMKLFWPMMERKKGVAKHNYISLKHKARYNNNNRNEVKRKIDLILDQGKHSGMSLKFCELNY